MTRESWPEAAEAITLTAGIVTYLLGRIGALPWQRRRKNRDEEQ